MTNVIPLASPRAATSVHLCGTSPQLESVIASRAPAPQTHGVERQQAIENALSMALYHIRRGSDLDAMRNATAKAIRAASMLKQACAASAVGGRV